MIPVKCVDVDPAFLLRSYARVRLSVVHAALTQTVSVAVENLTEVFTAVEAFLTKFSKQGFLFKMYNGIIDARKFTELDMQIVQLSAELGSALDIQVRARSPDCFTRAHPFPAFCNLPGHRFWRLQGTMLNRWIP